MKKHRDLCILAHFDRHNRLEDYVLHYCKKLNDCGFDIILVSTCDLLSKDREKAKLYCRDVICRDNEGLDFGSWARGFALYGREYGGEILLANDSVYGPLDDLGLAIARVRALPGEVRGMVESLQSGRHLQSWFLLLSPSVHQSEDFRNILELDFKTMSKGEIITAGEVGLSMRLREAGFRTSALFSLEHRHPSPLLNYNPTHSAWRELIEDFGIPFIKVELLRDNPVKIAGLGGWRDVVGAREPALIPMIESHLDRVAVNWAGKPDHFGRVRRMSRQGFVARDIALDRTGKTFARDTHRLFFETVWQALKFIQISFFRLASAMKFFSKKHFG